MYTCMGYMFERALAAAAAAAAARRAGDVAAGIPSARAGNGYAPVAPAVAARLDAAIRKRASGKAARGVAPSSEHGRALARGYAAAVAFVDVQVGRP